jgi:hypothetical protein
MLIIPIPTCSATREINVLKEHTCARCGVVYRYQFRRKKTSNRFNTRDAEDAAEHAIIRAMTQEADRQPCPGCGLYQPDMIAPIQARRHWYLAAATLAFLFFVLIFACGDFLLPDTTVWVVVSGAGLFLLGHLIVNWYDPNRNLDANRRLAQSRVDRGELRVMSARDPDQNGGNEIGRHRFRARLCVCAVMVASLLVLACPEVVRLANGWPTNPQCRPIVVGPGDDPGIYFPQSLSSLNGLWRGTPTVEVLNYRELGLPDGRLQATSNQAVWGQAIFINSKQPASQVSRLWANPRLPDNPDLAGKTLVLKMSLTIDYPLQKGPGWMPAQETVTHTTAVELAPRGAGHTYCILWWVGFLTGSLLLLLSGALLAVLSASFRRLALPTKIVDHPLFGSELDGYERMARSPGVEIRLPPPPNHRDGSP